MGWLIVAVGIEVLPRPSREDRPHAALHVAACLLGAAAIEVHRVEHEHRARHEPSVHLVGIGFRIGIRQ